MKKIFIGLSILSTIIFGCDKEMYHNVVERHSKITDIKKEGTKIIYETGGIEVKNGKIFVDPERVFEVAFVAVKEKSNTKEELIENLKIVMEHIGKAINYYTEYHQLEKIVL